MNNISKGALIGSGLMAGFCSILGIAGAVFGIVGFMVAILLIAGAFVGALVKTDCFSDI